MVIYPCADHECMIEQSAIQLPIAMCLQRLFFCWKQETQNLYKRRIRSSSF